MPGDGAARVEEVAAAPDAMRMACLKQVLTGEETPEGVSWFLMEAARFGQVMGASPEQLAALVLRSMEGSARTWSFNLEKKAQTDAGLAA